MSITLATIASGSSGNSNLVISGNTVIMSDCGISGKKAISGLNELGLNIPDAILLTHSHQDHVKGVFTLAKKWDIPIYATEKTADECSFIPKEYIKAITPGNVFSVSGIDIKPFSVSHDTASPVAYTFTKSGYKAAIITDTGTVTEAIFSELKYSESIIIESNHDEKMLMEGPYPYFLKKRILSDKGHMSNTLCSKVCKALLENGTKNFMLAHLSEHNNTASLAEDCTKQILETVGISFTLKVAKKDEPSCL